MACTRSVYSARVSESVPGAAAEAEVGAGEHLHGAELPHQDLPHERLRLLGQELRRERDDEGDFDSEPLDQLQPLL